MTRYLHEGGDVSCGGPQCLAVLASREKELTKKKEREEQERKEQELIQKMNEEILIKDLVNSGEKSFLSEVKDKANNLVNNAIGTNRESCLIKQGDFADSVSIVKGATVGVCGAAIAEGLANPIANTMCGSGATVSVTTDLASRSWKSHCNQLPKQSDTDRFIESFKEN